MFADFQRVWTPVLFRRQLRDKPVPLQIAGENVVLFRNQEGVAGALLDRCPHRGVALSLGRRTKDGNLACAFHGWEFNERGDCMRVPFNADAKCSRLGVMAFPVYEGGGLVWMYTGQAEGPVEPPHIPEMLRSAKDSVFGLEETWSAHWTRTMENMMDNAHVPFVHGRTIGFMLKRHLRRDSTMSVQCSSTERGFFITGVQDDKHIVGVHEFNRPNGMVLWVDGNPGDIRIHIYCIPVNDRTTRLMVLGHFGRTNWVAKLFTPFNRYVVLEDKAVVESSQPAEVPPASEEKCVPTDRGTLLFRKYYYDVLKDRSQQEMLPALRIVGP